MGELDISKKSRKGSINIVADNKVEIPLQRNSINVNKMEKLTGLQKAEEQEKAEKLTKRNQLFARMVENSMEKNLKLKVQADQKMDELVDSGWANISFSGGIPKQKLATIRKDGKWSSTEESKIKEAKKTFRNADVCTVRELDAINNYFITESPEALRSSKEKRDMLVKELYSDDPYEDNDELGVEEIPNKQVHEEEKNDPFVGDVKSYIRSIADMNFSGEMLTDEYLSDHIVDMYRFCDRIQEYPKIKERDPHFFDGITEESRVMLEGYAAMGENLRTLLDRHLNLHGIEVVKEKNEDGRETGILTARLYREDENKTRRHKLRETKQKDYDWLRRNFLFKHVGDNEIRKAETYSGGAFSVKNSMAGVESLIKKCGREYDLNKAEVDKACEQMKEIMELRASIIEEEKEQLKGYKTARGDDLARYRAALKKNNRRINLLNKNISRYQQYISFALGQRETLSPNTMEFLGKEGMDDLLELVRTRSLVDAADEAMAIAKGEANVQKRTAAEFMDMYADAKEKAELTKEVLNRANTRLKEADEKANEIAEQYHMKKTESTIRLSGALLDGAGTFKEHGWDIDLLNLAVSYVPTEQTPDLFVKNEIIAKGIRPVLDELLAIKVEDLENLKFSKNSDIDKGSYWTNRALLGMLADGSDGKTFLSLIRNYGIELTDEQFYHIESMSYIGQLLFAEYEKNDDISSKPEMAILRGMGLQEHATWLEEHTFKGLKEDDYKNTANEKAFFEKYSALPLRHKIRRRVAVGAEQIGGEVDTTNALHNISKAMYFLNRTKLQENETLSDIYNTRLKERYNKNTGDALEDELKRQRTFFEANGEEEAKAALKIRDKSRTKAYYGNLKKDWEKNFAGVGLKSQKFEKFEPLLLPVERDLNGTVKADFRENYKKNNEIITKMISTDADDTKEAVVSIGKEMAGLKLDEDFYTEDFILKNFIEVRALCRKAESFKLFHADYRDIFEGEDFTDEEREYLKNTFLENKALSKVAEMVKNMEQRMGIEDDGSITKAPAELKTKEEKQAWGEKRALTLKHKLQDTYDKDMGKLLKEKEEKEKYFEENREKLQGVTSLEDKLRAKFAKIQRERRAKLKEVHNLNAAAHEKTQKTMQITLDFNKLLDECEHEIALATELKKCVYNNGNLKELSDELKVFAADNGFEFYEENEINEARINLEKKWMEDHFTFTNLNDVKLRLHVNEWRKDRGSLLSEDQLSRWTDRFHSNAGGFYDIRCFQHLLRPVKKDAAGRVLKGYEENAKQNDQDIEDFLSGDSEKMFRVMHDIGVRIANIELPHDRLTWEYLEEHFEEVYDKFQLVFEFENMYREFADFFESDAFTAEEQDSIRQKMMESGNMSGAMMSQFLSAKGYGEKLIPVEGRTMKQQAQMRIDMAKGMFEVFAGKYAEDLENAERYRQKYEEKGDEIRALSRLWAAQKGRMRNVLAERRAWTAEINALTRLMNEENLKLEGEKDAAYIAELEKEIQSGMERQAALEAEEEDIKARTEIFENAKMVLCGHSEKTKLKENEQKELSKNLVPQERTFAQIQADFAAITEEVKRDKLLEDEGKALRKGQARGAYARQKAAEKLKADNELIAGFVVVNKDKDGNLNLNEKSAGEAEKKPKAKNQKKKNDAPLPVKITKDELKALDEQIAVRIKDHKANEEAVEALRELIDDSIEKNEGARAVRYMELIRFAIGAESELSKETVNSLTEEAEINVYAEILSNRILEDKGLNKDYDSIKGFKTYLDWDHKRRLEESEEKLEEEKPKVEEEKPKDEEEKPKDEKPEDEEEKPNILENLEDNTLLFTEEELDNMRDTERLPSINDLLKGVHAYMEEHKDEKLNKENKEDNIINENRINKEDNIINENKINTENNIINENKIDTENNIINENRINVENNIIDEEYFPEVTDEKADYYFAELIKKNMPVPQSLEELGAYRNDLKEYVYYQEGKELKGTSVWKQGVDKFLIEAYDFLDIYFKTKGYDETNARNVKPVSIPKVRAQVDYRGKYESQGGNNCFCCTGTAIYNQFVYNNDKKTRGFVNQFDMRKFEPKKYRSFEEVKKAIPFIEPAVYDEYLTGAQDYMGKYSHGIGSIFEEGDFFLSQRDDFQLKRMKINTPSLKRGNKTTEMVKNEEVMFNNQKAAFVTQVSEVLKTGNLVGLLINSNEDMKHYRTIRAIDSEKNKVTFLDSYPVAREYDEDIDKFFRRLYAGNSIELTWFEKLESPKEMTKKYKELNYTNKDGYSAKYMSNEAALNLAQINGVCFGVRNDEMPESMRGIGVEIAVYIPKKSSVK